MAVVPQDSFLQVLIVGAGQIGALADSPQSAVVQTHAHAIFSCQQYCLLGFIEPQESSRKAASQLWHAPGYADFSTFRDTQQRPDVVVIASPDHMHWQNLHLALDLKPRVIIVEKPLVTEVQKLSELSVSIPIVVNYTRRYMPIFRNFLNRLEKNEFGRFLHGAGTYSKGLIHSGSHLINALLPILNKEIKSIHSISSQPGYNLEDPSISALVEYVDGSSFLFRTTPTDLYEAFEIDLFFEKVRIRLDRLGRRISYDYPQSTGGNKTIQYLMDQPAQHEENSLTDAYHGLYQHVFQVIQGFEKPFCDIEDSRATLQFCETLRRKSS